ncbi:MAG: hypothetical protein RL362_1148 [Bacteroidota bacterium]
MIRFGTFIKIIMKVELEKIITVSGKPGLFKVISGGKNVVIAESLLDGKRHPIHSSQKVSTLSDISMFTTEEDIALREVLENAKNVFNGEAGPSHKSSGKEIREAMLKVLPNYDQDRVYESDLKKFFQWYNLLQSKSMLDFAVAAENAEEAE